MVRSPGADETCWLSQSVLAVVTNWFVLHHRAHSLTQGDQGQDSKPPQTCPLLSSCTTNTVWAMRELSVRWAGCSTLPHKQAKSSPLHESQPNTAPLLQARDCSSLDTSSTKAGPFHSSHQGLISFSLCLLCLGGHTNQLALIKLPFPLCERDKAGTKLHHKEQSHQGSARLSQAI